MQFIDLAMQQQRIRAKINANLQRVLDHGQYIMGPEVAQLEQKLAAYVGVKHAVACSSGTDALLMALMALGVGPGDAVFTTPFTFIATAEVISLIGAVPVFVDVDDKTYNIAPEQLEKAVLAVKRKDFSLYPMPRPIVSADAPATPKCVIAVDLYGLPADYPRINELARTHGLSVIEDAAQSFGGEINGVKACALAEVGCTSFFPAKPLGCYGDGGMCFTESEELAGAMRSISLHGKGDHKYDNVRIGINGRLDTLQAAILAAKLEIFPEEVELRQEVARSYTDLISSRTSLVTPAIPEGYRSAWAQYSLLASSPEDRLVRLNRLKNAGIPTAIYYPRPLHLQSAFAALGYQEGDFPVSEDCAERVFSLPMHPYLQPEDIRRIVENLV